MINQIRNIIFKSDFNRNVAKLISGTVLASIINFLSLPVLARIYSVEDFGHFQLLFSLITIFGVISCLKYEMALTLPEDKARSDNLFFISILILTGFTGILYIILTGYGKEVLSLYKAEHLIASGKWIAPAVFSLGLYELMNYVFMRNKAFGKMAKYRVMQVSLIQASAIFMGLYSPSFENLIFSFIFGNMVISLIMIVQSNLSLSNMSLSSMSAVAFSFRKFPMINTPMALVNTFSMQLPVFMLSVYFSSEIVGYYMMASRILTAPMQLISRSVGRVYYKEAADSIRESKQKVIKIFNNTIRRVAKIGLIPSIIVIAFAPILIKWFLGEEWIVVGTFMQIMMPWIFFQFVNISVSTTFSVVNRQEIGFLLIVISVLLRYMAMNYWHETAIIQITALSIVASLFYISYMVSSYIVLRKIK
ncbi:MAG: oligosaccharide flippase family protein [Candidatus Neomarinimicrobiota bacterium]|nr:oligosaccharide flippase family protein [Candidatus Neomarinimicrobiota bacterium]